LSEPLGVELERSRGRQRVDPIIEEHAWCTTPASECQIDPAWEAALVLVDAHGASELIAGGALTVGEANPEPRCMEPHAKHAEARRASSHQAHTRPGTPDVCLPITRGMPPGVNGESGRCNNARVTVKPFG
jgi:hypothetical protein